MDFEKAYEIRDALNNNLTIDDYDISLKAKNELKRLIPVYLNKIEDAFENAMKDEENSEFFQTLRSKTEKELEEYLRYFIANNFGNKFYHNFADFPMTCEKEDMQYLQDIFKTQIENVASKELYKIFKDRTNDDRTIKDIITLLEYFGIFVCEVQIEPDDEKHTYFYCTANRSVEKEEELINTIIYNNIKLIDKEELFDGLDVGGSDIAFCFNIYHENYRGLYDKLLYMLMGYNKFSPIDLKYDKLSKIFKEECEIIKKKESDI